MNSMAKLKADLVIKHAAQLVSPKPHPLFIKWAEELLTIIEDGALAVAGEQIIAVGKTAEVLARVEVDSGTTLINGEGKTVTPGLVDSHTHPIFIGTREDEFEMRLQGKSYQDIAAAGGGIHASVRRLRQASKDELIEAALPRLHRFLRHGTTTIEAKSGYGLSLEDEIKSLEVIRELNHLQPVELIPTFLGAHEVPDEFQGKKERYVELIINEMLPRVAEARLAEFCDVFCEEGVFSVEESRRMLLAAKGWGLTPKIHADQFTDSGGASLAAEVGAISADHCEHTGLGGMAAMVEKHVVPVLLPGSVFFLGLATYPPARTMIERGLPVALATDFNPGSCMTESLPIVMSLACLQMRMTPAETLVAVTYHGAAAIARSDRIGRLDVGMQADCVLWDAPNYKHLAYHFGVNLATTVIKKGKVVWQNQMPSG